MCCSINVYVDGCCVQRLSVGNGEGSVGELKEELARSLDPLVLQAKLEEEEGCVAPPLDRVQRLRARAWRICMDLAAAS